jgi:hypothetical protein
MSEARLQVVPGELERTPPHDVAAEQATLGGMLLSATVIAEVTSLVRAADFYRPAHELIYTVIVDLVDAGQPADVVTVAAELTRRGEAGRIGGVAYLHTLLTAVPMAVNAGYYASIVAEHALRRRLVEAGTRITSAGYSTDGTDLPQVLRAVRLDLARLDAAQSGWPPLVPLELVAQPPEFPLLALPPFIAEFAAALADETQTPPDLAASICLAVLSTAGSRKVRVHVEGAWHEPVNLYLVVALPPAARKSPVFKAACAPLLAAERALIEAARPGLIKARLERKIAEERAERSARDAAKADNTDRLASMAEAIEAAQSLAEMPKAVEPRLFLANATPEAIATNLADQGGRIAVLSAEGEIFNILAGRYSSIPNFEVFLLGHAGDDMRVTRTARHEQVEDAALTLGICTQPAVLTDLAKTPEFRSRGMLGRVLFSVPDSLVGRRSTSPPIMPPAVASAYQTTIQSLTLSLHDLGEPQTLTLTSPAREALRALQTEIEPRLGSDLAHIGDWAGKWVGSIVRIAGLLHLATHLRDGYQQPISAETIHSAAQIGRYYLAHALIAFDAMGTDTDLVNARTLLDWITRNHITQFAPRDILANLRQFKRTTDIEPALRVLAERGYLRRHETTRSGPGRPAVTYETHPELNS